MPSWTHRLEDFEVVTTLALILGAVGINLSHAGKGLVLPASPTTNDVIRTTAAHPGLESFLLNMFPENIAQAVAQNQILQIAVFAILFCVALSLLIDERKAPLLLSRSKCRSARPRTTVRISCIPPLNNASIRSQSPTVNHNCNRIPRPILPLHPKYTPNASIVLE